jgi:hypothetical protein
MLASYFVIRKGKKVHILVNNAVLGERDKDFYAPLYDKFRKADGRALKVVVTGAAFKQGDELNWRARDPGGKITYLRATVAQNNGDYTYDMSMRAEDGSGLKVPQSSLSWPADDVDVTYTPLHSLKVNYMNLLMKGGEMLGDTLLLVDEVDDIIVGPDGMSVWGVPAQKETEEILKAYAGGVALRDGNSKLKSTRKLLQKL